MASRGRRTCYEGGRGGSRWNSGSADCRHGMAMKAAGPGRALRDATGSGWDAGAMAGTRICVARRPSWTHHLRRGMAAVTDSALNQRTAADIGAATAASARTSVSWRHARPAWPGCPTSGGRVREVASPHGRQAWRQHVSCVSCAGQLSGKHTSTRSTC